MILPSFHSSRKLPSGQSQIRVFTSPSHIR
jgi:hypothetical protein